MCGIVGIFNPGGLSDEHKDKDILKNMALSLHHRGPDEKGVLYSDIAYLGHARLSILDLVTGQQPMCSHDKRIAITFNGEIYNYLELKEELKKKNYRFKTTSDTETLIYLYQEYGAEMLQKINGQFSIGIVDYTKKKLFLARDRIGIRPLYYTFIKGTLIFSSAIKTILLHPNVETSFNFSAYNQLINLWSTYGKSTFFENISSLIPGEYLEYTSAGIRKDIYWDLSFDHANEQRSLDEWKEQVFHELNKAVSIRLRADVPVNAYLSGGLDSSIILKLIQKHHKGHLESFSVRFSDKTYDETSYQELMTRLTDVKNSSIVIGPAKIAKAFKDVIYHCEQPIYRTAPGPLYYLSKLVNDNNYKVVLTGEGADEVALGYNIFKETNVRYNLNKNPNDSEWLSRISGLYPYLAQFDKKYSALLIDFYKKSLGNVSSPLFSHQVRMNNGRYVLNFLTSEVRELVGKYDIAENIVTKLPMGFEDWTYLQKAQYIEMKTLLAGYLLSSQGDRMSMAHSVEGRYPFLDHNVVNLFSQIPDEWKLHGMNEKYILKESFKDMLPEEIIQRSKQPYRTPEAICLLNETLEKNFLNEDVIRKHRFFNWGIVKKLKNKLELNPKIVSFNDNFAYVNIVATTIFQELCENRFIVRPVIRCDFNEEVINE